MAKIKLQPEASSSNVFTIATPAGSADRVITLPDSTGTLATTDDNGSQLDHSGTKKIEATSTGASVTGVGKFFLENNSGAGGGIVASNTNASNPATGGFLDLMERDVNFGTANNYGVRLYYDGSSNKFHIQGGNETTVATHLTMVRDSGEITIDTGDLIFGTAGKGIVLGATTNVDANTLDDYETGTWTPVMNGTSGGTTQAVYVKVGRMVTCHMMNWGFTATAVDATVSGLPFTSNGAYITGVVSACDWVTNAASVWGYSNSNLYVRDCVNRNEGTGRAGSPRYFSMSITYRTT